MLRNLIFILISLVAIYVFFLYVSYIDSEITTGKSYGYEINMSKEKAFKVIVSESKTNDIFVMYPLNENELGPLIQYDQDIMNYEYMKELDQWVLYFNDNYHNVIKLSFSDNKLIKIYRHRKYFELP